MTAYTHRQALPVELVRAADNALSLTVYDETGWDIVEPESGSVTVYADGVTLLDAALASVGTDGSITATLPASDIPESVGLTEDALEVWALVIDGAPVTIRRQGSVVRAPLVSTLHQDDLSRRHPDLPDLAGPDALAGFVLASREYVRRDLIRNGNRPQLILSTWQLQDLEIPKALELAFRALSNDVQDDRYRGLAAHYEKAYKDAWSVVKWRYDWDEDGSDAEGQATPGRPSVIQTGRRPTSEDFSYGRYYHRRWRH